MREFPSKQDENHLTTGDALPPHRFLAHWTPCPSLAHIQVLSQLPEQLSSAIQPGPATLFNGTQCPLRDKILLRPSVSSQTSPCNNKDSCLVGTPQLFRIPQRTQIPQISTQPVRKLLSEPLILELVNIQPRLGWYCWGNYSSF